MSRSRIRKNSRIRTCSSALTSRGAWLAGGVTDVAGLASGGPEHLAGGVSSSSFRFNMATWPSWCELSEGRPPAVALGTSALGTLALWHLALWHFGTLALWHFGTLALTLPWHFGTLALCCRKCLEIAYFRCLSRGPLRATWPTARYVVARGADETGSGGRERPPEVMQLVMQASHD
jgi:hypothetical protein